MNKTVAVVLAAGLGTRMKSKIPKVLHKVAGVPMVCHVVNALREAGIDDIILVLGHGGQMVEDQVGPGLQFVYQHEQLGTGHALLQALPILEQYQEGQCLVVCGDTPLLRGTTLQMLLQEHQRNGSVATVLTACLADPTGYGRVVKKGAAICKIVEEKDADSEEKAISEINTGTYCFSTKILAKSLKALTPANAQGEYYLTDVIKILVEEGEKVQALRLADTTEALGINNRIQLACAENQMRQRILEEQMLQGVTIINPGNTYIDARVKIGRDTIVYPGVFLEGETEIGEDCIIGPDTRIVDSRIDDKVSIVSSTVMESKIASGCTIGPYSYLRPGTELCENVKIGDFVEVKKSYVGSGSKIPHLSYVGDSTVGKGVNIGAGTITCNYDGVHKHPTIFGDGAFVGSNTNLVAPVSVGAGAYIGAGSTITEDIPAGALAVARGRQRNLENWKKKPSPDSNSFK